MDKYSTFIDRLQGIVAEQPEKTAFTFLQDGETESDTLSYQQLETQAKAIATVLQSHNATGARALLLYQPGLEFITAFLGCLYAGVVAVPAYPPRANRSIERLLAIVADADAKFALTTQDLQAKIEVKFHEAGKKFLKFIATDVIKADFAANWRKPALNNDNLAFLQYTSGSTGVPKGVMVSHGNLLANSISINSCFQNVLEHHAVSWLPPYHDMGLIGCIIQPMYVGLSMYLMPPVSFLQRPYRWLQAISKYRANTSGGPNFAYDLCLNQITEAQKANLDLSYWELAFSGAEPIRASTMRRFGEYFGSCGFRVSAFYPCYGMAESTLIITGGSKQNPPVLQDFEQQSLAENQAVINTNSVTAKQVTLVGCGNNLDGQHLVIVNPDTLEPCKAGEIGEIWTASASVAQGYWNRTELTDYAFRASLKAYPNIDFLRTGDLGFIRDGELFVTGRLKDLIIIRGRNHYPQDIELTVDRAHQAIRSGVVAAFAVEVKGVEKLVITAEVKRTYLRKLDPAAITKAIRQAVLQNHELNPHAIVLIKTGSIPKTSSGKIQRHACKARFLAGSLKVVGDSVNNHHSSVNPQQLSTLESWLVENIAQRLGVSAREIDKEEAFASLGLDSVQAIRLSADLADYLQVKLSPTLIYDYPNISSLAAYLTNSTPNQQPATNNYQAPIPNQQPIAIIGMGCRFPGAENPAAFWELVKTGKAAISQSNRWEGNDYGGFIADVDRFDPQFFGITPRETQRMDPQQRLLLEVSWSALENAAIAPESLANTATGVFIGISSSDYSQLQLHYGTELDAYAGTGNAHSIAANRLSYSLDLKGPSLTLDTACSSSLVAVHLACQSLRNGECQTAIAGGVNLILAPELTQTFALAGMLAADGKCKTFDAAADGYVRGEGCGVIILKPLATAISDRDNILAVIQGSAINQDGRSNGLTAPNSLAQQAVIRQAIANAQIQPQDLSYIEAHGTGTKLGDPIEVNSLKAVLASEKTTNTCYLASVKPNIGHLEAAAGIAGLIKTVLCLQHSAIPPHLNFNHLNPHIDLTNTPLAIPTQLKVWQREAKPRFAGVSSFGFGGTNAHVILGDAANSVVVDREKAATRPWHLLTLSAKNASALKDLVAQYHNYLQSHPDVALEDICFTANTGRTHFNHRLAITAESISQLSAQLSSYLANDRKTSGIVSSKSKIAFLFTGQGSQYARMGEQLYQTQPKFRQTLDSCAEILQTYLGVNIIEVIYPNSELNLSLNQTQYTQPAIFTLEYALAQMWLSWGIQPDVVMGHSVGEYVAATIAGVFSLESGLKLIAERGKLMQALPRNGAMYAVFADEMTVSEAIKFAGDQVAIAAINGTQNTVISGDTQAVSYIISKLESQGINSQQLTVSHAFHSPLMQPILEDFRQVAQSISYNLPQINLVSNVTGEVIKEAIANPEYWVNHIIAPVKFAQGMQYLSSQKCDIFLEIGAKPILLGMGRNILENSTNNQQEGEPSLCLPSLRPRKSDWSQITKSLAALYCQGSRINWQEFEGDDLKNKLQLPTYPFQRQSYWLEKREVRSNRGVENKPNLEKSALDYYQITWQKSKIKLQDLTPKFAASQWIIFADQNGLAAQIAQYLQQHNQSYLLVYPSSKATKLTENSLQLDYQEIADFKKVITQQAEIQGIIYLWSLDELDRQKVANENIISYQEKNCTTILNLLQTLFIQSVKTPIWLVTRGTQEIGDQTLSATSINSSSLWGLGKVIASEHPEYYGGIIDLDSSSKTVTATQIIALISNSEQEDYLALRQENIYLPRLKKVGLTRHQALKINASGCYLITGGLGALGLQVAQLLVAKGAKNLVLIGRSEASATAQATIKELEQKGATIETIQGDICDLATVEKIIASRGNSLKGVVHAAGILDDGLLQNQTWQKFQKVLKPKIIGAWNLHQSTKNLDLDFFILFSSVASLIGSPGQGNY
ncbi:MAG TPA: SDR family NAD(P)-dependent oxidoreductase, partial [Xenococcaceae cyanobacterium]